MSVLTASAQIRIGHEAQVALPTSAHYSGTVNIRPGNGEIVNLNPPIFSWFYVSNILKASWDSGTRWEFQFQVSTDKTFTNNIVNKRTPSNLYNTLAPFTNADGSIYTKPLFWRVGYVTPGGATNLWSQTNSFTVSSNAAAWDRSMLADEDYLASKFTHPHLLFNAATRPAVYQFSQTNNPSDWALLMAYHNISMGAAWWTNSAPWSTTDSSVLSRTLMLGSTLTYWALSQNPAVTNHLAANYQRFVDWFLAVHYEFEDYGGNGSQPWALHCLVLGYDWLYPILNTQQKSNAVFAIQRTARFYNRNAFWSTRAISGHWELDPTGAYNEPRLIPWYNSPRTGTSHQWRDSAIVSLLAAAAYGEGGDAREFFDLWINYMIGRTHFTGGFAAINQGRGYASVSVRGGGIIWNTVAFMSVFPEAQLNRIPTLNGFADWFSRLTPPGYRGTHGMFGDGGDGVTPNFTAYWNSVDFRDLALLTRSGEAWQAHLNEKAFGPSTSDTYFYQIPSTYTVWPPPAPKTNSNAKAFLEDGWVIASTKPGNAIDAFTNGLGFIFVARPRGTEGGHSINCDGGVEMWAYGAKVTDSGAWNLDPYGYRPEAQDTLFVNGQGVQVNSSYGNYSAEPILPWYSRIAAYKTSADFTYALGDITPAFTNAYNPQKANVLKVRRHVLFSRTGKYFMLYDELATRNPSTFHWQWHVLQPTLRNLTTSGFVYSSTNRLRQSITNHIFHASSGLAFDNMTGASALKNPFTGVTYTDAGDPFRRANALWFRNATQATNFNFLSVIVPQEPGKSAPSFTRLDNHTVAVTYDGVTETNTFGTNYAGAYTYRVELLGDRPMLNVQVPQGVRIAPPAQ
jgi:hypothetical protein